MKGWVFPGICRVFAALACASVPVCATHLQAAMPDRNGAAKVPASPRRLSAIIFLRHGIRAPLDGETPRAGDPAVWATWNTQSGMLTTKGYQNAQLLGRWFGAAWRAQGLLSSRCPGQAEILIRSNIVARTIDSAKAFAAGVAPGCGLAIAHNPEGQRDPIFDPIASGAESFDPVAALAAEHRGPGALLAPYARDIEMVQRILGCTSAIQRCGVESGEVGPITADRSGIRVDAKTAAAAGAAQVLMLQFAEGLAMPRWQGKRLGAAEVERLSILHAIPFTVQARAPYLAARLGRPFLAEVRKQFDPATAEPRIRIYVGHDNTISALTARLGIDFRAAGYARNDPPIGGAFGFELLADASGERRVRSFYIAQTPAQLRRSSSLVGLDRPWLSYYSIAGCDAPAVRGCPLSRFLAIIDTLRITAA